MKIFITLNPHIENLSKKRLLDDFTYVLQKYYRKKLGRRYFKHIDKQYEIAVFEEVGKKFFEKYDIKTHLTQYFDKQIETKREPHLHIIAEVPLVAIKDFFYFLKYNMIRKYKSLTSEYKIISTSVDEKNVWNYCNKECGNIITKTDLCKKKCYQ